MHEKPVDETNSRPDPFASLLETALADPMLGELGRELLRLDSCLGLFRLVHLVDAITKGAGRAQGTIVSIGSGAGFHEAFVARLFPRSRVIGVDLRRHQVELPLPNLSFRQGDLLEPAFAASLPRADFVFSIECLEHIDDDESVVASMGRLVLPGGALYIEVPFATESDLADPAVVKEHLDANEHVRPGYTAARLAELCGRAGLTVEHLAGAFWFPMQPLVWFALQHHGTDVVASHWHEFLDLAMRDVRQGPPRDRGQATGLKGPAVPRERA